MGLTGSTTPADASQQLSSAIDFGQIAEQHAPAGDPIFAAVGNAETVLSFVNDNASSIAPALVPGTSTYGQISDAIDGVYAAAANLTNDPSGALPSTIWALPAAASPWLPVAIVGGLAVVAFFLFRGDA